MLTIQEHKKALSKLETVKELKEYIEENNEFNGYSPPAKKELISYCNLLEKGKKKVTLKKKKQVNQKTIFLTD